MNKPVCVGADGDGRIAITAKEAWPDRGTEPPRLSASETATGCAVFAACFAQVGTFGLPMCLAGDVFLGGTGARGISVARNEDDWVKGGTEERAIPMWEHNERWAFFIRAIVDSGGNCDVVNSILTDSPDSFCDQNGCFGSTATTVTCSGDIATIDGVARDCSHAFAHCSTKSPTGCTDRAPMGCHAGQKDKCDGDVKLGCDSCSLVTFHDCAWNGGRCVQTEGGAHCEPAGDSSACVTMPPGCDQNKFWVCVSGLPVQVDCAAMGMACTNAKATAPAAQSDDSAAPCGSWPGVPDSNFYCTAASCVAL